MPKYRKKPVVIEAVQWTGDNFKEMENMLGNLEGEASRAAFDASDKSLYIFTLEGEMKCDVGDYVIKGVNKEVYPCKPDIFEKTYEKVDEQ